VILTFARELSRTLATVGGLSGEFMIIDQQLTRRIRLAREIFLNDPINMIVVMWSCDLPM